MTLTSSQKYVTPFEQRPNSIFLHCFLITQLYHKIIKKIMSVIWLDDVIFHTFFRSTIFFIVKFFGLLSYTINCNSFHFHLFHYATCFMHVFLLFTLLIKNTGSERFSVSFPQCFRAWFYSLQVKIFTSGRMTKHFTYDTFELDDEKYVGILCVSIF